MEESLKSKVLLVDDRAENIFAMSKILGELEVDLFTAGSGNQALSYILRHDFAVVLLDVKMPDMNGFETAALIRTQEKSRDTPIVFITAVDRDQQYAFKGYQSGAIDYLSKPIQPEILRAKVKVFLELHRRKQERERLLAELQENQAQLELRVKERTAKLEKYADELKRSNAELEDFAYIASHDLKEPLRGINHYSRTLLKEYHDRLDEAGQRKLETLQRLTVRMENLIDSLLYYSRVGRTELAMEKVDLDEVLAEIVDSLHIGLRQCGVEVRIPQSLPTIYCDKARIREVFQNLISNAMKYNDKGEKWIEVGAYSSDDHTPVVFYVRDNGIGIREKHLKSIFNMFKRLHPRDKFGGGAGTGLTIAHKIVERHHGKIWAESVLGEGTTFYFTLEQRNDI